VSTHGIFLDSGHPLTGDEREALYVDFQPSVTERLRSWCLDTD